MKNRFTLTATLSILGFNHPQSKPPEMHNKNTIRLFTTLLFLSFYLLPNAFSQNVGIGTSTPDASAKLDVVSTSSGMLVPRVSLSNVTSSTSPVSSPATGLLVWNTNATVAGGTGVGFYYWSGTSWTQLGAGTSTDDQNLSLGVGSSTTSIIDMENGSDVTIRSGAGIQLSESGNTLTITNSGDPSTTNELQTIAVSSPPNSTNVILSLLPLGNSVTSNDGDWDINGTALEGKPGNSTASGSYALAAGFSNTASGNYSVAIGSSNIATAPFSTAIGGGTNEISSTASYGTAIGGAFSNVDGYNAHSLGTWNANVVGDGAGTFAGIDLQAFARNEVVIGCSNTTYTPSCNTRFCQNALSDRLFTIGNRRQNSSGAGNVDGEALIVHYGGNLFLGSDWSGSNGTGSRLTSGTYNLLLNRGTAPGSLTTARKTAIWNQSGEIRVKDESNNITVISPHNFNLIPEGRSEDLAWAYYSERNGKTINVDMAKTVRLVEQLSGESLIYIKDDNSNEIQLKQIETSSIKSLQTKINEQDKIIEQQQKEINDLKILHQEVELLKQLIKKAN